jgi:hypothetical protein
MDSRHSSIPDPDRTDPPGTTAAGRPVFRLLRVIVREVLDVADDLLEAHRTPGGHDPHRGGTRGR